VRRKCSGAKLNATELRALGPQHFVSTDMRLPRRSTYLVGYWRRVLLVWPLAKWRAGHLQRAKPSAISGDIRIVDANLNPSDDETFTHVVLSALALIERHDPRRRSRIDREISFIVNRELVSWGLYSQEGRICSIDFGRHPLNPEEEHYHWHLARFACLLIHESTHAYLHSKNIPYTRRTRLRIERICHREERRFAARLPTDRYNFGRDLIRPFDGSRWEAYWNLSFRAWFRLLWKRLDESEERGEQQGAGSQTVKPT
jgi:hypothetical protein